MLVKIMIILQAIITNNILEVSGLPRSPRGIPPPGQFFFYNFFFILWSHIPRVSFFKNRLWGVPGETCPIGEMPLLDYSALYIYIFFF